MPNFIGCKFRKENPIFHMNRTFFCGFFAKQQTKNTFYPFYLKYKTKLNFCVLSLWCFVDTHLS